MGKATQARITPTIHFSSLMSLLTAAISDLRSSALRIFSTLRPLSQDEMNAFNLDNG